MLYNDTAQPIFFGYKPENRQVIKDQIERAENEGMPVLQDAMPASSQDKASEVTTLERRVLAHERILQSLIAHLTELDPQYMERLKKTFVTPLLMKRYEQNYVETEDYAAEFIRAIEILGQSVPDFAKVILTEVLPTEEKSAGDARVLGFFTPTLFMIRQRENSWDLLVDGRLVRSFELETEAFDEAVRMARRIASRGPLQASGGQTPDSWS
ncbi:hypothetical protein D2N39_12760 [Gemmobacter lutimaris]|uniref:Uncharacterized protein n=1 Tax=Gemmobacter lutimaris TaxID=2306023 RepID=A0A398BM33_9RHOB|nr:hypothetical protein [Gemmobacter lutimaris]RID91565.1 hypothetical protein D2N39_12760 [Gemmobacter lutimaris]